MPRSTACTANMPDTRSKGLKRLQGDQSDGEKQDQDRLRHPGRRSFTDGLSSTSVTSNDSLNCDVLIVGAGPAGLMLACNLARYGIKITIVDDRSDKTITGRGDGLQPKTIETFRHLGLADKLLSQGVKAFDICFWNSTETSPLSRTGRQVHYPTSSVDTLHPYVLLLHQGMIESILIEDLASRGVHVERNTTFISCEEDPDRSYTATTVVLNRDLAGTRDASGAKITGEMTIKSKFVIGCDGAHSRVRKSIPSFRMVGGGGKSEWGVIDGILNTNFPDIWSKAVIQSHTAGSLLCIPREENMTRLYVELDENKSRKASTKNEIEEFTKQRAKEVLLPFFIDWESIVCYGLPIKRTTYSLLDWFLALIKLSQRIKIEHLIFNHKQALTVPVWSSTYTVSQRVCSSFISPGGAIYLVGDAAHTHSPKAAQGMNVSMHDSFNLAWKLNLFIRGIAKRSLLVSYEEERLKVAQQLIEFDVEHAKAFEAGDSQALAENFDKNIGFISGIGVEYNENVVNVKGARKWKGQAKVGALLPPACVTRYIDENPVHIQLDIPLLGQFRIYFLVSNVHKALKFLESVCNYLTSEKVHEVSLISQASSVLEASFEQSLPGKKLDKLGHFGRYTSASRLFTLAVVTTMKKSEVEIAHLPVTLQKTPWTFYLDNRPSKSCAEKWIGGITDEKVAIINVRPDGYIGSMDLFNVKDSAAAKIWLGNCFTFLQGS